MTCCNNVKRRLGSLKQTCGLLKMQDVDRDAECVVTTEVGLTHDEAVHLARPPCDTSDGRHVATRIYSKA